MEQSARARHTLSLFAEAAEKEYAAWKWKVGLNLIWFIFLCSLLLAIWATVRQEEIWPFVFVGASIALAVTGLVIRKPMRAHASEYNRLLERIRESEDVIRTVYDHDD